MSQDKSFFVSRTELLAWLNGLLQLDYKKVEDCASGAIAEHLLAPQILTAIRDDPRWPAIGGITRVVSCHEQPARSQFAVRWCRCCPLPNHGFALPRCA